MVEPRQRPQEGSGGDPEVKEDRTETPGPNPGRLERARGQEGREGGRDGTAGACWEAGPRAALGQVPWRAERAPGTQREFHRWAAMAHLQGILTLLVETSAPGLQVGGAAGRWGGTFTGNLQLPSRPVSLPRPPSPPPRPGRGETQPLRQLGARPLRPAGLPTWAGFPSCGSRSDAARDAPRRLHALLVGPGPRGENPVPGKTGRARGGAAPTSFYYIVRSF